MIGARRAADARSERTREALIEAAEARFAELGIEGASLRQIGVAIGSANPTVVAYHFGNKAALIRAIFHHRLASVEPRRAEMMRKADAAGRGLDLPTLLDAMFRPLFEQVNDAGQHAFLGFIEAVLQSGHVGIREELTAHYPASDLILRRLAQLGGADKHDKKIREVLYVLISVATSVAKFSDRELYSEQEKSDSLIRTLNMMKECFATSLMKNR